jgi:ribosomal protein L16
MLIPRKVKHRKQHHPKRTGAAKGGTEVTFGTYGLQALEPAYVTNRQIESARIAITRHIRRGGKVWINIYPQEFRGLTDEELVTRLREAKEELFNLRFQGATGQLENHGRLRAVRKDIARLYTVMRERELGITPVGGAA